MANYADPSILSFSQNSRYSKLKTARPKSSIVTKNGTDMFRLGIENRKNLLDVSSQKRLISHNIYIPTGVRLQSPPPLFQPTPTPDLGSTTDHVSRGSSPIPIPVRIKSAAFAVPSSNRSQEAFSRNFPSQFHERRKLTEKRKQQKQQFQKNALDDSDTWFHLRQSLAELKRLATTEEILVDPTTSLFHCDGYSFEALKQAIQEQQEQTKVIRFKSDSGMISSTETTHSYRSRPRTSASVSRTSLPRPRSSIQRPTEIYVRPIFEPFLVASKPLHPLLLTGSNRTLKIKPKQTKLPFSAPPSFDDKRYRLTSSDLSNENDQIISFTPSPVLQNVKEDEDESQYEQMPIINTNSQRPSSTISLKSTIKLKPQVPRCRSANEIKQTFSINNKTYPRFILITDQEHRIESWYHQYPFILSDDLIQAFQSKPNKSTVSAYFIDEHHQQQPFQSHFNQKTYLQGKPFHINNDWKKYDLIFISKNIYHDVMIHLQTIIKLSGKVIHVSQLTHNEDLKSQVKNTSKQFHQQLSSHV